MAKYKKNIVIIITIFFIVFLISSVIVFLHSRNAKTNTKNITAATKNNKQTISTENIDKSPNSKSDVNSRDSLYKMFYGKWKVNKVLAVDVRIGPSKDYKDIIGKTIEYSYNNIKIDDIEMLNNPEYDFILAPTEPNTCVIETLPSISELGIQGKYFAAVDVANRFNSSEVMIGGQFYIKDNLTLIMFDNYAYYELTRISNDESPNIGFSNDALKNATTKKTNGGNYNTTKDNFRDPLYKLFYGEWKINRVLAVDEKKGSSKESKNIIGKTIEYSYDNIKFNKNIKIDKPIYHFILAPTEPDKTIIENLPSIKELGMQGKYFIGIEVADNADIIGSQFYVKDDSTLIMFYQGTYYELTRISHTEDTAIGFPG
ncbi:MAG: hypothetical protein Q8900_00540 [Bacillota bacterium]|nr:hypothetical protein [Bacillota bacterium]